MLHQTWESDTSGTQTSLLRITPPPPCFNTLSLKAERKSPASHESSTVTGVRWVWDHTQDHKSFFLLHPLPSIPLAGDERRDGTLKAYISVDEEINQIISGVRKGAQRKPSWSSPFEM